MKKPKRKRRSVKREQIIMASESLFIRHGAKRVTIEEICRNSGVSKMTFYKYFRNKIELVRAIRDEWMEEGFRKFDEINAMDLSFPKKIDLMTGWKVELASRMNAEFIRQLVPTEDIIEEYKQRYLGNIIQAQNKGEIRSDIDPEFLWLVMEKLGELFMEGSWKRVFAEFSQYQEQVRTLLFYGLLIRKEE